MAKQQIFQTKQGTTLIYQKQSSFNGYSFAIGFRCGAQLDGKYWGLSHLLEHLLFSSPNPKSTNLLLDNVLKYTINQNAHTSQNCIYVTFSCTDKNVDQALDNCMNNIIGRKPFTQAEIDREREVVKQEMMLYKDAEKHYIPTAYECLIDSLQIDNFDMTPLDIVGTNKTLNSITADLLNKYIKRYFNAENLIVSVTSNKPAEKVLDLCGQYILPKIKPATSEKFIVAPPVAPKFKAQNLLVATPNDKTETVSICLLLRERTGKAKDINLEYAYDTVEEYMMNHMGSLLWDLLREKNQLVYGYSLSNVDYDTVKFKAFDLTTTAPKMRKSIAEVCKLIRNIAVNGVPKEKFETVKKVLTDIENAKLNKFKPCSASSNFNQFLHGYEFIDYKKVNDYLKNMTYEDFNQHIQSIYAQANVSLAVEGKFDYRKCYNLIEIEKMLGNYSHVKSEKLLNLPRFEHTDINNTIMLDAKKLKQLMGISEEETPIESQTVDIDNEKI